MTEDNKEKATVAIANSILGQITLSDVLQLVQGNVLNQAKTHVETLSEDELGKLIQSLDASSEEAQNKSEEQESTEEELEVVSNEK